MKLYNSKTNKIEEFQSIKEKEVSLYLCGPTVYDNAHIGNARPIVVFDLLRRVLKEEGYKVKFVSNFTDIDDKIVTKAINEMTSEKEVADKYIEAYENVRNNLYANGIDAKPRVTEVINEIIEFIEALIEKDYAYIRDGDVYFRVNKIDNYGHISSQKIEDLQVGARIEENVDKEDPLDFVLWKNTDTGIKWTAPWGEGRPGWHTECVVMIHNEFGGKIDIHGGGMDLRFPHHENESAQNFALHDDDLANYWVHNAMLQIDGEKMSKSIGNVILAKDFIAKLGSNVTRWLLLSTHYRLVLNVSDDTISQAQTEINRIQNALDSAYIKLSILNEELTNKYDEAIFSEFMKHLSNDLNVDNAKVSLFDVIREINTLLRQRDLDIETLKLKTKTLAKMVDILGLYMPIVKLSQEDKDLFTKWNELKAAKEFAQADEIRDILQKKGYL